MNFIDLGILNKLFIPEGVRKENMFKVDKIFDIQRFVDFQKIDIDGNIALASEFCSRHRYFMFLELFSYFYDM